jgi:hypothetical protein
VWNFDFCCGKNTPVNPPMDHPVIPPIIPVKVSIVDAPIDPHLVQHPLPLVPPRARRGESKLAHEVVLKMVSGLEGKGHLLVMDNYFSSIGLFQDLLSRGIYATSTMRTNRIGLPTDLKNTKDKKPVLLISTHARPIQPLCERPIITVPHHNGAIRESIQTSPVLHKYTTDMRGVDVADQGC